MPNLPPTLSPGDRVAIVCTARKASHEELAAAVETLTEWGLDVVLGASTNVAQNQFGGSDEVRRQDLQQMLDRPDIRAILVARGG